MLPNPLFLTWGPLHIAMKGQISCFAILVNKSVCLTPKLSLFSLLVAVVNVGYTKIHLKMGAQPKQQV
jgi:hypothetical protein